MGVLLFTVVYICQNLTYNDLFWHYEINPGNGNEWSPIRSVIIHDLFNHKYAWLQTELDNTKYCYQLIMTITIFVMFWAFIYNWEPRYFESFLLGVKEKKTLIISARAMAPKQLTHDACCSNTLRSNKNWSQDSWSSNQVWGFCYRYDYIKNWFLLLCMLPSHYPHTHTE